jgi:mRNA interferase RelE/StbE
LACWRIEFEDAAKKELAQLDRRAQKNIRRFLRERIATEEDPRRFGDPLQRDLSGFWKYRVGDCRIVADIQDELVLVLVVRVGHRSKVYGGH